MKNVLLVKYGEIAIRGKNRYIFEGQLIQRIKKNMQGLGDFRIFKEQGRFLIESADDRQDWDAVVDQVVKVLGVVGVCPGIKTRDQSLENLQKVALHHAQEMFGHEKVTFKVETKRADKRYPMESRAVSREVGWYLLQHMPNLSVDVHNPQVTLWVELRNDGYVYSKIVPGFGGLPVGSTGKGTLLLSGGIDSSVAGWMIAKRGVEVQGVYFHSAPYTSERAKEKVIDLAKKLSEYTGGFKLYVIPFTDLQLYLYESCPAEKLTILLKRSMLKIAEKIAVQERSQGLITGDSIGQVASQTMQSLAAVQSAVEMPILRPLAGLDKQEIVNIAKKIGTFETSILPYEDCCTIFVAKHPETKPKIEIIEKIEGNLNGLKEKIEAAVEGAEVFIY